MENVRGCRTDDERAERADETPIPVVAVSGAAGLRVQP